MVADKGSVDVFCVDVCTIKDLTGNSVCIFRFGWASRVRVSFIQATSIIIERLVYEEVGYGSGDG